MMLLTLVNTEDSLTEGKKGVILIMTKSDEEFEKMKKIESLNYDRINIPKGTTYLDVIKLVFPNGHFQNENPFEVLSGEKFYPCSIEDDYSYILISKELADTPYKVGDNNG